jgi:hypothetical protein
LRLSDRYPKHADLITLGDDCNWAWECWQIAKQYCNDPEIIGWSAIDSQLATILKEYCLLQLAKLHDPAKSGRYDNHTLQHYCVKYGCDYESSIAESRDFIQAIVEARNKLIAHNDLEARRGGCLGAFVDGDDEKYFVTLRTVLTLLYATAGIGPFPDWPSFVTKDVDSAMQKIRQLAARER